MHYSAMGTPAKQSRPRAYIDCLVLVLFVAFVAAGNLSILARARHQGRDSSSKLSNRLAAEQLAVVDLGPTTDAPMMPQPPFSPGCFPRHNVPNDMHEFGCPIIDCSLAENCTVSVPSCCAYVNFQVRNCNSPEGGGGGTTEAHLSSALALVQYDRRRALCSEDVHAWPTRAA